MLSWWRICLQCRRPRFNPWVKKIPWRRKWQPTPVFLPGESIPWTEEPGGLQSLRSQRVRHDLATKPPRRLQYDWCSYMEGRSGHRRVFRAEVMGDTVAIHNLGERPQKNPNLLTPWFGTFQLPALWEDKSPCLSHLVWCVHALLCPTLCVPMDYSSPGSSVHGIFQARNTGVGCHFLL